jgi:group I intron endonuclease
MEGRPWNRPGIYQIRNTINEKKYVGSAVDLGERWRWHRHSLRHNSHRNQYLQRAWNKYGESSFVFEVLQVLEQPSKEELLAAEQHWLNALQSYDRAVGYNILLVAGNTLGRRLSEGAKAKLRAAHLGKTLTEEHRANIAAAQVGGRHTDETIEKMRQSGIRRAKEHPEAHRRFQSVGSAVNARKTHCPQGHPYDEQNTIHRSGRRTCRACETARLKRQSDARRVRRQQSRSG